MFVPQIVQLIFVPTTEAKRLFCAHPCVMQVEELQRDCFGGHAVWHPNDSSRQTHVQIRQFPVRAFTPIYPSIGTVLVSERCSLPLAHLLDWDSPNSPLLPHLQYPSQADDSEFLGAP